MVLCYRYVSSVVIASILLFFLFYCLWFWYCQRHRTLLTNQMCVCECVWVLSEWLCLIVSNNSHFVDELRESFLFRFVFVYSMILNGCALYSLPCKHSRTCVVPTTERVKTDCELLCSVYAARGTEIIHERASARAVTKHHTQHDIN